jgi:hypothetical protein
MSRHVTEANQEARSRAFRGAISNSSAYDPRRTPLEAIKRPIVTGSVARDSGGGHSYISEVTPKDGLCMYVLVRKC